MIKVLDPGIYSSIQDKGRFGYSHFGVPVSGCMDSYSADLANILLNNKKTEAVIEVTYGMAKFEFSSETFICITGADYSPKINHKDIEMMSSYKIEAGDVLSFGKRKYGARIYIAVKGGVRSKVFLESRSFFKEVTPNFRFKKSDTIPILSNKKNNNESFSKVKTSKFLFESKGLKCFPGPEFDKLNDNQIQILKNPFTISEENDRVGYRLIELIDNNLTPILTSAVIPGTVQLTPAGKLIILMRDAQVTGGYPRVLQLDEKSINILAQKSTNDKIQFLF